MMKPEKKNYRFKTFFKVKKNSNKKNGDQI
jgi:hypothetical protein